MLRRWKKSSFLVLTLEQFPLLNKWLHFVREDASFALFAFGEEREEEEEPGWWSRAFIQSGEKSEKRVRADSTPLDAPHTSVYRNCDGRTKDWKRRTRGGVEERQWLRGMWGHIMCTVQHEPGKHRVGPLTEMYQLLTLNLFIDDRQISFQIFHSTSQKSHLSCDHLIDLRICMINSVKIWKLWK